MDLFQSEESLSPRLAWMEKRDIKTMKNKDGMWMAYKSGTAYTFTHEDEVDAVVGLAKKMQIKLWKEEL